MKDRTFFFINYDGQRLRQDLAHFIYGAHGGAAGRNEWNNDADGLLLTRPLSRF